MNNLSWLLYIADVIGNLGPAFVILGCVTIVVAFLALLITEGESGVKGIIISIIVGVILLVTAAFIPSKETVYAIAASEMGEELLKTPTAAKATKALDSWLDKQITEQTKEVTP